MYKIFLFLAFFSTYRSLFVACYYLMSNLTNWKRKKKKKKRFDKIYLRYLRAREIRRQASQEVREAHSMKYSCSSGYLDRKICAENYTDRNADTLIINYTRVLLDASVRQGPFTQFFVLRSVTRARRKKKKRKTNHWRLSVGIHTKLLYEPLCNWLRQWHASLPPRNRKRSK